MTRRGIREPGDAGSIGTPCRRRRPAPGILGLLGLVALVGACADHRQPPEYLSADASATKTEITDEEKDKIKRNIEEVVKNSIRYEKSVLGPDSCTLDQMKKRKYTSEHMKEIVDQHVLIARPNGAEERSPAFGEPYWRRFHRIMTAFEKSQATEMLIYVNGGNVSKETVLDQAAAQIPCMTAAKYFPVFLIWEAGALKAYVEQIARVRNGRLLEARGATLRGMVLTAPLHVVADLAQGVARAPVTFANSFTRWFESNRFLKPLELYLERAYSLEWFVKHHGSDALYRSVVIDDGVMDTGPDVAFLGPTDVFGLPFRIVTTPFLDSMGKTAWENMRRRSRTTVHAVWEFQHQFRLKQDDSALAAAIEKERRCYPRGAGVFSKFFQDLQRYFDKAAASDPWQSGGRFFKDKKGKARGLEITVIGHSMGAMVLNELIPSYRKLPFNDIVYLAAAGNIRDFERSVPPVLASERRKVCVPVRGANGGSRCEHRIKPQFHSLMLHPLRDARERNALGTVLMGSLLEWIDDIFEGPETILDRTLGLWRNAYPAMHVFDRTVRDEQMTFRVFGFLESRSRNDGTVAGTFCRPDRYWPPDPATHSAMNDNESCFWTKEHWASRRPSWAIGPRP